MIAPTRSAFFSASGLRARGIATERRWTVTLGVEEAPVSRPAPRPKPRRLSADLDGLLTDGAPIDQLEPARSAARAFSAGDGFLPGQIIDRAI